MTETASAPAETTESVEEFAARARAWLADNMPPIDPNNPPNTTGAKRALAAGTGAEEALRGRIRGHLLPEGVRRPWSSDRLPEGIRQRIALLRAADHPQHADLYDLRRDDSRHRL